MFNFNRNCDVDHFIIDNKKYISEHTEIEKIKIKEDVVELQLWFHGNGIHYTMIFSDFDNLKFRDSIDWDKVIEILTLMLYFSAGEFGKPSSAKIDIADEFEIKEGTVIFQKTENTNNFICRTSLCNSSRDFWDSFWEEQLTKKK